MNGNFSYVAKSKSLLQLDFISFEIWIRTLKILLT